MKHALRIQVSRQTVNHPLVAHVVLIMQGYVQAATGWYAPLMLVETKCRICARKLATDLYLYGDVPGHCCAVLGQALAITVHGHAVTIERHVVMMVGVPATMFTAVLAVTLVLTVVLRGDDTEKQ